MAGQRVTRRFQGTITLDAFGKKFVQQLERGELYRELVLRLSGTVTYAAGASNTVAGTARGDEWSLINTIRVVANGNDVIREYSGTMLRLLNFAIYGNVGRIAPQIGDATTAAPAYDSTLIIPFWQPMAARPMDTAFDSSKAVQFRLEVITETAANFNTGTAPTGIAGSLDIGAMTSFGLTGMFTDCKISPLIVAPTGAGNNWQLDLPVTSLYRAFLINVANGGGQEATDLPNAVTNIQIKSGGTQFFDMPFRFMQDWHYQRTYLKREYIQNVAATSALTGGFTRVLKSLKLDLDAWAFLDLVPDGYLTEAIDSYGFSELKLLFNTTAACTITVLPIYLYPPRDQKAAA